MHAMFGKYSRIIEAMWDNAIKGWLGRLGGKENYFFH
jgi:hypothetical protein